MTADPLWDAFDPDAYHREHYATVRDDDRQILHLIADWFTAAGLNAGGRGVDVGPGANLYPTLAMLPHCRQVTLVEHGAANRAWLRYATACLPATWQPFWDELVDAQPAVYKTVRNPAVALHARAVVVPGSVYDLPLRRLDVGTMMFVAESITTVRSQFQVATRRFVQALTPGAPFAAGFMTGSTGYTIAGRRFPAVPVQAGDILAALAPVACDVELHPITSAEPLRPGVGMLLATGRAR